MIKKIGSILQSLRTSFKKFEVIKCKDCSRSDNEIAELGQVYCRKHMNWVDKEGFCSSAERKERLIPNAR